MQLAVDYDDYVSILAYVFHLSRRLEPAVRDELPALLGRRKPSGLWRVAEAAGRGRLHWRSYPRQMLPVIVDACSMAIEDGTGSSGDWVEIGWSDGGIDWGWRETMTYTDEARQLMPLRAKICEIIDLLDRIDDLIAAQRDIVDLLN